MVLAPLDILPHVSFLKCKEFESFDSRRIISGVAGDFGFPMQLRQIKLICFSNEAIKNKLIVGNHRHFGESGQWEMIIVLGKRKSPLFRFRYRNYIGKTHEKVLMGGDVVLVPPGCSLALLGIRPGVQIIEISNQEYKKKNYIDDKLF